MVDTESVMRYDVHLVDLSEVGTEGEADFSFAAFSLEHAGCGDDVVEVRVGRHTLLEWCMACHVMEIFGPGEG
ncbi:MAG: hypothetical protein H0U55_12470 [Rubrobacteraceae bacterium]|nr:hypothetical protein [Rubrobacteraceae bacterium]